VSDTPPPNDAPRPKSDPLKKIRALLKQLWGLFGGKSTTRN
jgi:hypothetical protein